MAFVQIMEFTTTDYEDARALSDEWWAATDGKRTLQREVVARDRNDPNRYIVLAFFESYESAMENSNLPETQRIASQFEALTDTISYRDLDVIDELP